jgi:guanylate kinase
MSGNAHEGRLIVISGPSGVGKTTICHALRGRGKIVRSVSATTRDPRPGEVPGRDYFFLKREEFLKKRDAGGFLEWAEYAGNLYGTPKDFVEQETKAGNFPLLEIEVQGVVQLRKQGWPGVYVFIAPPSIGDLRKRLEGRGNMPQEVIERRIKVAEEELKHKELYDFTVVNDTIDRALLEVLDVLDKKLKKE